MVFFASGLRMVDERLLILCLFFEIHSKMEPKLFDLFTPSLCVSPMMASFHLRLARTRTRSLGCDNQSRPPIRSRPITARVISINYLCAEYFLLSAL